MAGRIAKERLSANNHHVLLFDLGVEINSQGLPAFSRTELFQSLSPHQESGTSGCTGNECTGFPLGP